MYAEVGDGRARDEPKQVFHISGYPGRDGGTYINIYKKYRKEVTSRELSY